MTETNNNFNSNNTNIKNNEIQHQHYYHHHHHHHQYTLVDDHYQKKKEKLERKSGKMSDKNEIKNNRELNKKRKIKNNKIDTHQKKRQRCDDNNVFIEETSNIDISNFIKGSSSSSNSSSSSSSSEEDEEKEIYNNEIFNEKERKRKLEKEKEKNKKRKIKKDNNNNYELEKFARFIDLPIDEIKVNPPQENAFTRYMEQFQVGSKKDNPDVIDWTHGSMGWKYMYSVPTEQKELDENENTIVKYYQYEVLKKLADAILRGDQVCIDEKRTEPFKFFADLDFKSKEPINLPDVLAVCGEICRAVRDCFPKLKKSKEVTVYKNNRVFDEKAFGVSGIEPVPYNTWPFNTRPFTSDTTVIIQEEENNNNENRIFNTTTNNNNNERVEFDKEALIWQGCGRGFGRLRCLLSYSATKEKDAKGNYCLGIHANWIGDLRVTQEEALRIRLLAISRLEKKWPSSNSKFNSWEDIFDRKVYLGQGGVRMLGTTKIKKCPTCKGSGFPTEETISSSSNLLLKLCPVCKGKRNVSLSKYYRPLVVLDGNGNPDGTMEWLTKISPIDYFDQETWNTLNFQDQHKIILLCKDNFRQALYASSIRSNQTKSSQRLKFPKGAPHLQTKEESALIRKKGGTPGTPKFNKNSLYPDTILAIRELNTGEDLDCNSKVVLSILASLGSIDPIYEGLIATRFRKKGPELYHLDVKGEGMNYCMNKGDNHKNRIYFHITPEGIIQRCYSDNPECLNYKSRPYQLKSKELRAILFKEAERNYNIDLLTNNLSSPLHKQISYSPENVKARNAYLKLIANYSEEQQKTRKSLYENFCNYIFSSSNTLSSSSSSSPSSLLLSSSSNNQEEQELLFNLANQLKEKKKFLPTS